MGSNKKDTGHGYLKSVALAAPAFGAKAIIGDLPKGTIEHTVESKLLGSKKTTKSLLQQGFKGRGSGRAIGAGIGILTAPIFLQGLKNVSSKDKSTQMKGLALLGSTAAIYQGQKGFVEGYRAARAKSKGVTGSAAARHGLRLGATRISYKTPAALAMGLSIAAGRKKKKDGTTSTYKKYMLPALSGAAMGALARGAESVAVGGMGPGGRKGLNQVFRKATSAAGGGAAGGLLGGLVLSAAVDGALKAMEKNSSITKEAIGPLSMGLAGAAAHHLAVGVAALPIFHGAEKAMMGYGKPGALLRRMPGGPKTQEWMQRHKVDQLAIGIREGLAGRTNPGLRSGVALGVALPSLKYNRQMGIEFGKLLRGVPPGYREQALEIFKKGITPVMKTSKRGEPTPVWNQLPEAIDKAIGKGGKSPFATGMVMGRVPGGASIQKAYQAMLHSGRGALSQEGRAVRGLPKTLAQDSKKSSALPDLIVGGAGLGALGASALLSGGATIPAHVAAGLAGFGGAHLGVNALKGLGTKSKTIQDQALQSAGQGVREAFLPGMRKSRSRSAQDLGLDYIVSPASRDFSRTVGGAARRVAEMGRGAMSGKGQQLLNRGVTPARLTFSEAAAVPMLAGAGAALATRR